MGTPQVLTFGNAAGRTRLTHQLFRYPAKFHPPVVEELLRRFTSPGDVVFDPFVGSGTLLVEAALQERISYGLDIDPVAVMVATAKSRRYDIANVENAIRVALESMATHERPAEAYRGLMRSDISDTELEAAIASDFLEVPAIPNIDHWFRKYVVVDLARIKRIFSEVPADSRTRVLLQVVLASIIRNSSNADPVPVSGLEYTAHMRRRDLAGREVNPYALARQNLRKTLRAIRDWTLALPASVPEPRVYAGSALRFTSKIPSSLNAVVTSPPYHNAVDYYRRHKLEMFWLGLTTTQADRLALLPSYIGRPRVPQSNPLFRQAWNPSPLADVWERKMRVDSPGRANDFRHYVLAMTAVFNGLSERLSSGSPAVFVLGHSQWNGEKIPTESLFAELAAPSFTMDQVLAYPIVNRYMSYSRHNSASIDREYVLVLRRC